MSHNLDDDQIMGDLMGKTTKTHWDCTSGRELKGLVDLTRDMTHPIVRKAITILVKKHASWYNTPPIPPVRLNPLYHEIVAEVEANGRESAMIKYGIVTPTGKPYEDLLDKFLNGGEVVKDIRRINKAITNSRVEVLQAFINANILLENIPIDPIDDIIDSVVSEVISGKPSIIIGGASDLAAKGVSWVLGGIDNFFRKTTEYTAAAIERNKRGG